jgi:hypothetical protein
MILTGSVSTSGNIARLFDRRWRWRLKLKYIIKKIFPSREAMYVPKQHLGSRNPFKQYLPYLQLIQRKLKRQGKTLWSALRGEQKTVIELEIENKRNYLIDWLMKAD